MEHLEDDKLQRYFDGELTDGEASVVRHAIDDSDLEQARLRQLHRLSEVMTYAEDAAVGVDGDALFAKIEAGIAAQPQPRLQLIEGAKRKRTGAAFGVAIAIAAAALLAFLLRPTGPATVAEGDPEPAPRAVIEDSPPPVIVEPPPGTEVVKVEFGHNTGTVFEVEGDHGQPIAVVWISDEEDT